MSLLEWLKFWSKFYRIPLFWNTVSEYPSPPRKWKLSEILALWLFSFRIPPPPNWNLGRSWHFDFSVSEYPPSPQKNWNLGRSWHFDFSVSEYPPPPENWNLHRSWHFKIFLFHNNWYQWQTMCGNLPHVETLSSPDNYSLSPLRTSTCIFGVNVVNCSEFLVKVKWAIRDIFDHLIDRLSWLWLLY